MYILDSMKLITAKVKVLQNEFQAFLKFVDYFV